MSTEVKIEVTDFNTNNAWGFGGGIGKLVKIGDFTCRYGKAYFRHLKPEAFCRFFYDGDGRHVEVSQKVFETGTGMTLKQIKEKVKKG